MMTRWLPWIALPLTAAIVASVLVGVWYKARRRAEPWVRAVEVLAPGVTQRVENFERRKFEGDRLVWEVRAEEAEYSEEKKEAKIREVSARWVMDDGRAVALQGASGSLRLSADFRKIEELWLRGDVTLSWAGYRLQVEAAEYRGQENQIRAPGRVVMSGPGLQVEGQGLTVDVARERLSLGGRVEMSIVPGEIEEGFSHDSL